jgi:arylsulfatase
LKEYDYFTHMEGSLRTPSVIRWPQKIPAGRVSNEVVHEVDTYATIGKIAGEALPTDLFLGRNDFRR